MHMYNVYEVWAKIQHCMRGKKHNHSVPLYLPSRCHIVQCYINASMYSISYPKFQTLLSLYLLTPILSTQSWGGNSLWDWKTSAAILISGGDDDNRKSRSIWSCNWKKRVVQQIPPSINTQEVNTERSQVRLSSIDRMRSEDFLTPLWGDCYLSPDQWQIIIAPSWEIEIDLSAPVFFNNPIALNKL